MYTLSVHVTDAITVFDIVPAVFQRVISRITEFFQQIVSPPEEVKPTPQEQQPNVSPQGPPTLGIQVEEIIRTADIFGRGGA
jgi:hypothetical protein